MPIETCPNCGSILRFINAGISKKNGKPYHAFYACSGKCGYTQPGKSFNPYEKTQEGGSQRATEPVAEPPRKPDVLENLATKDDIEKIGLWITNVRTEISDLSKLMTSIEAQIIGKKVKEVKEIKKEDKGILE
jgi:hypothetical protein